MKKNLILFFVLVMSILGVSQIFTQEKQKISGDFFRGKWGGTISGVIVIKEPPQPRTYPFSVELVGHSSKFGIGSLGGGAKVWMKLDGTWPNKFTYVDSSAYCFLSIFEDVNARGVENSIAPEYPFFTLNWSNSNYSIRDMEMLIYITILNVDFKAEIKNKNLISLTSRDWDDSWAKGELHMIYVKKDTLGKTVQINEPIKTDEYTQRDIVVPNLGEVTVNTNSDGIFKSESELDLILGEIYFKIKSGSNYKVQMPQAVCGVRGTQFITKVEKDGTTTLTVIDGEVEFSDIKKKATVVVRKNQRSVVKPGGLPTEPEAIEQNQIPKWWK
jgi:hypothetical protein